MSFPPPQTFWDDKSAVVDALRQSARDLLVILSHCRSWRTPIHHGGF